MVSKDSFVLTISNQRYFLSLTKEEIEETLNRGSFEDVQVFKERSLLTRYPHRQIIPIEPQLLRLLERHLRDINQGDPLKNKRVQLTQILQDNLLRIDGSVYSIEDLNAKIESLKGINYQNSLKDLYIECVRRLSEDLRFEERVDTVTLAMSSRDFAKYKTLMRTNSVSLRTTVTRKEIVVNLNTTLRGRLNLQRIHGIPTFL